LHSSTGLGQSLERLPSFRRRRSLSIRSSASVKSHFYKLYGEERGRGRDIMCDFFSLSSVWPGAGAALLSLPCSSSSSSALDSVSQSSSQSSGDFGGGRSVRVVFRVQWPQRGSHSSSRRRFRLPLACSPLIGIARERALAACASSCGWQWKRRRPYRRSTLSGGGLSCNNRRLFRRAQRPRVDFRIHPTSCDSHSSRGGGGGSAIRARSEPSPCQGRSKKRGSPRGEWSGQPPAAFT